MTWRFILEEDFVLTTPYLVDIDFENKFIKIKDSTILIRKGYAWDGCSPSCCLDLTRIIGFKLWFGTWDGPIGDNGKSVSNEASLVHDALCQFRKDIHNLSKENAVDLFKYLLNKNKAPAWMITNYPVAVNKFGPQDWTK